METDNTKDRIALFQKELKRIQNTENIIKTSSIRRNTPVYTERSEVIIDTGVEVFLDNRISPHQIRKVVHYIIDKYNFDTYYFTKTHSIKVWYKSVK